MICDIQAIAGRLASKARQLLGKKCTCIRLLMTLFGEQVTLPLTYTVAEGYINVRSKFDGGKQINRSQREAWKGRCGAAGLKINEGPAWGPAT